MCSLCPVLQIFRGLPSDVVCHLSGFVYTSSNSSSSSAPSPACPAGSSVLRLFWQSAVLGSPVDVPATCLLAECGVPALAGMPVSSRGQTAAAAAASASALSEKRLEAWSQELRGVFAKLINKKPLNLNMIDYDSFFEYYTANTTGNSAESKRISDARGGKK